MDLSKVSGFFDPKQVKGVCNIIGAGSVGSVVAELLVRNGITAINLFDDDIIEPHNLGNQLYTAKDISRPKTEALSERLMSINSECEVETKGRYENQRLSGYVFLCVDNIETRKAICEKNSFNVNIKAVFDFRTGKTSCETRAAAWNDRKTVNMFISSMDFTHDEAREENPTTACGQSIGLMSVVMLVSAIGVDNFITYIKSGDYKRCILMDAFANGGSVISM